MRVAICPDIDGSWDYFEIFKSVFSVIKSFVNLEFVKYSNVSVVRYNRIPVKLCLEKPNNVMIIFKKLFVIVYVNTDYEYD